MFSTNVPTPAALFEELAQHTAAFTADMHRTHLALTKEFGSAGRSATASRAADATSLSDVQALGSQLYARAHQSAVTLSHMAVQSQFSLARRVIESGLRLSPEAARPALAQCKEQLEQNAKQAEAFTLSWARKVAPGKAFAF